MMLTLNYQDSNNVPQTVGLTFAYDEDGTTSAFLTSTDETREPLAMGSAFCHPSDQPNKKVGRKLAFQRAVEAFTGRVYDFEAQETSPGDVTTRRQLWAEFMRQVRVR